MPEAAAETMKSSSQTGHGPSSKREANMIDVGAYSSRPDAADIPLEEEWQRLDRALSVIRGLYPDAILSVDTFRAEIARRSVERHGVQIINDISGGELDKTMFETVASLHVPYILMHMRGTPQTMQQQTHYDNLMAEITEYFARRVDRLHQLGVSDIILDPGFGFSKTLDDNYRLMHRLRELQPLGLPLLTGDFPEIDDLQAAWFVSRRKSDGDNRSQYHRPDGRYSHFTGT